MSKKYFLRGTFLLTCTGLLSRSAGFFYRIFLSHSIGAKGIGIFQLTLPVQALALAVSSSGIPSAISRFTASKLALKKDGEARQYFFLGTAASLLISTGISWLLCHHAAFFSDRILKEHQTLPLIRFLAFSLPMSSFHSCMNSYYFARKKTIIPSCLQLLEQTVRISSSCLLYKILIFEKKPVTAVIAAGGTLISEIIVTLVSLIILSFHFQQCQKPVFPLENLFCASQELWVTSLPLTLNRILLTLLSGAETILIPHILFQSGCTKACALEIYGIFTGMALPLILFPSALVNSAAVLLTPSVSELQALELFPKIRQMIHQTIQGCILFGSLCALVFFLFGKTIGTLLFHTPKAGLYIRTLSFMCPFLYLNTALSSIMNGLGKSGPCLIHNITGIMIRLFFLFYTIPRLGMKGYLYGMLLSELICSLLHLFSLLPVECRKM